MRHLSDIAILYGQSYLVLIVLILSYFIITYFKNTTEKSICLYLSILSCFFLICCSFVPEKTEQLVNIHVNLCIIGFINQLANGYERGG